MVMGPTGPAHPTLAQPEPCSLAEPYPLRLSSTEGLLLPPGSLSPAPRRSPTH